MGLLMSFQMKLWQQPSSIHLLNTGVLCRVPSFTNTVLVLSSHLGYFLMSRLIGILSYIIKHMKSGPFFVNFLPYHISVQQLNQPLMEARLEYAQGFGWLVTYRSPGVQVSAASLVPYPPHVCDASFFSLKWVDCCKRSPISFGP